MKETTACVILDEENNIRFTVRNARIITMAITLVMCTRATTWIWVEYEMDIIVKERERDREERRENGTQYTLVSPWS